MADYLAVFISGFALIISWLSHREAAAAVKAAVFDQRFAVYTDAEKFLSRWLTSGQPELADLQLIMGAWSRSQFLFEPAVTQYLLKVWKDSVRVGQLNKTIDRPDSPDREAAIDEAYKLSNYHSDFDRLREVFLPTLAISGRRRLLLESEEKRTV